MMRSMFSGVSGLRVHQTRMDVIAHNVSNVNTVGFKSSRVLFSDVFSQTVSSASGASEATGRGGVNPMQIGLGANVASIDRMMTQGAAQRTDHNFDLMIEGSGFFVVGDESGQFFTRAGALRLDHANNLTIANGMKVLGWEVLGPHSVPNVDSSRWGEVQRGPVDGIQIGPGMLSTEPNATTQVNMQGNLVPEIVRDADGDPVDPQPPTAVMMTIHDSLGNTHRISLDFTIDVDATEAGNTTVWTVDFSPNQDWEGDPTQWPITIEFDANGRLVPAGGDLAEGDMDVLFGYDVTLTPPASNIGVGDDGRVTLNFSGLTQFGNLRGSAQAIDFDGMAAGELMDLAVGQDGTITGIYSNGQQRPLFQIPIAEFQNPAGLEAIGGNLFRATTNSGSFDGVGRDGVMMGGVLEMSNVDLSEEFTGMIVTQRGFQANSRLISTSDEMLQELVRLGR